MKLWKTNYQYYFSYSWYSKSTHVTNGTGAQSLNLSGKVDDTDILNKVHAHILKGMEEEWEADNIIISNWILIGKKRTWFWQKEEKDEKEES